VVNVVVIFVSYLFWELHVCWVVVLTVNPSLYIETVTFCFLEWLAAFSFVISFNFVVSFDEEVDSEEVQSTATLHQAVLVHNIMWYL
jgi:hypothetical protein